MIDNTQNSEDGNALASFYNSERVSRGAAVDDLEQP